jgi:hypothetical protein
MPVGRRSSGASPGKRLGWSLALPKVANDSGSRFTLQYGFDARKNCLMKTMVTAESKEETKYVDLIENALLEFKEVQKELRRLQIKTERQRASSRRTMSQTWAILRRVEATL